MSTKKMDELNKKIIYYATISALKENEPNAHKHICKVASITFRQLGGRLTKCDWSLDEIQRMTKRFDVEFANYAKALF